MCRDTVEEAYLPMLQREAQMAETVWEETGSLFASLTPRQMMRLVATGRLEQAAA
jgi:hypothetical protein